MKKNQLPQNRSNAQGGNSGRGHAQAAACVVTVFSLFLGSCSTFKSAMGVEQPSLRQAPIQNPFGAYGGGGGGSGQGPSNEAVVLRTKRGDRSIEVELPGSHGQMTDFVVPVSPQFLGDTDGRAPASLGGSGIVDERYKARETTLTDREVTRALPQGKQEDQGDRREVEMGLGLVPADEDIITQDKSYLGAIDHIKQLYRTARYEAALLEVDEMLRAYPTDPKLYEMRGTLLDRTGRQDLALRSWSQALQLDPTNASLKRFVDRKQYQRGLSTSPGRMPASVPATGGGKP